MATITFPTNPSDGMIFEGQPGVFFQYSSKGNCWVRVDGFEALGLATPINSGLMDSEDLKKLNGLIIPPPQTSLKGEECPITFNEGKIRLISSDESLTVQPKLNVVNKVSQVTVGGLEPWALGENTVGVDFKLNLNVLVDEMKKSGKFTQVLIQGKQGSKGAKGEDGIDELDTGPQGEKGTDGQNSPFAGTVSPEVNPFELVDSTSNQAIVDVTTETSAEGNFLVVTRANIGNPDACPKEVKPKDLISPLVLVINQLKNTILKKVESPNDCGNPCSICVTSLHYLNLELLIEAMFERFKERVLTIKQEKEELVTSWIKTMLALFNEQKHAICCALENCRSSKRNERTRQYIETQKIQAALGDFNLILDGKEDRTIVNMDADKDCPQPGSLILQRGIGCDCSVQYSLDARIHATDPRSLFLDRPPGDLEVAQQGVFGTNRTGTLNVHQELNKPVPESFTADSEKISQIQRIEVSTNAVPPSQTEFANTWKVTLSDFSITTPTSKTGSILVIATLKQNGFNIGRFESLLPLANLPSQTLELTSVLPANFNELANTTDPLELQLDFQATTEFELVEFVNAVVIDYTLRETILTGTGSLAEITIDLKDDWIDNDWKVNGITILNQGLGFVQFDLPAGDYVAEITDCCANVTTTRSLYTGVAAIEYVSGSDRTTTFFTDLGTFNNNADARVAYLGSTFAFSHSGGEIRSWVVDRDLISSNNAGSIGVCIRPSECSQETGGTVGEEGAIFVYRGKVSPLNLVGLLQPFTGSLTAAENYGYNNITAKASDVQIGPKKLPQTTKSFLYSGPDGLTFYTIHGGTQTESSNNIKMDFDVDNNGSEVELRVADDPGEISTPEAGQFDGDWTVGTFGSDGLAFGPMDSPLAGAAWTITINPKDFGIQQVWQVVGADGNTFNIFVDANGIGTSETGESIIFTPIRSGCLMPFKQVIWLERGHRIGAACSAVVTLDGQKYIIVKRSIADDPTCGGGESLSNPCIADFINLGIGHPAIAWPTINGEEFAGIPTSGIQGFTFDQDLSDQVVAKIQAGETENVRGNPADNISIVLFPTAQ